MHGLILPFLGTILGSACVFFMRDKLNNKVNNALMGLAGGVMIAASIWSLIIPSINYSEHLNRLSFFPAAIGLFIGVLLFIFIDRFLEKIKTYNIGKSRLLFLAVSIHNLPEGMAIGVVVAGALRGDLDINSLTVLTLALGIGIQNFPEGAIISLPLRAEGINKGKSFLYGFYSAVVELFGAIITLFFATIITPILPYFLSFAAGAMIYVVIEELVPGFTETKDSHIGTISFIIGFIIMMILDVTLG